MSHFGYPIWAPCVPTNFCKVKLVRPPLGLFIPRFSIHPVYSKREKRVALEEQYRDGHWPSPFFILPQLLASSRSISFTHSSPPPEPRHLSVSLILSYASLSLSLYSLCLSSLSLSSLSLSVSQQALVLLSFDRLFFPLPLLSLLRYKHPRVLWVSYSSVAVHRELSPGSHVRGLVFYFL